MKSFSLWRHALAMAAIALSWPAILGAHRAVAQENDENQVAVQARAVLKQHCYKCHGVNLEVPGLDVLDHDSLTRKRPEEPVYLVPHDLDNSLVWQRVGIEQDMPPRKIKTRLTDAELATIKRWIELGAPEPRTLDRQFVSEEAVMEKILEHLRGLNRADRRHQRYFTLTNLYNNSAIDKSDLRLYRAAFVKLINSLSLNSELVQPRAIDASRERPFDGLIFNLDLRDVRWDMSDWRAVVKTYPYGLTWNDPELQELGEDIQSMIGRLDYDGIPHIRVDWFVANASRPPAYHGLLKLPETVEKLEKSLGVDVARDFRQSQLQRAGFASSGVSKHNRLVDRHVGRSTQYYYRSYDFGRSFGRGVLFRYPLGPRFDGNDFDDFAFQHDGSEVIWRLPNGMQGYFIVDKNGKRIDEAPVNIVRDVNEHSGFPTVVNGVSCIGCHKNGLQAYEDSIRSTFALSGKARVKVDQLFAEQSEINELIQRDRRRFSTALEESIGEFLRQDDDRDKSLSDFPEPVSRVVSWYYKDLGPSEVASELGFDGPNKLPISGNIKLQELGLGPLGKGYKIPRPMWDSREESAASVYQRAATALGLGAGFNPN